MPDKRGRKAARPRKPPTTKDASALLEAADSFVDGDTQTSERPESETSKTPDGGNLRSSDVKKSKTSEPKNAGRQKRVVARKQCTIYLESKLKKKLQLYSIETEQEMSDVVAEALGVFLKAKKFS